ncbi:MAG TPA: PAS domain-containing protein [Hyphomonadaceae bacterium]|nr:PAS domain-containing protein [Hyphomonadaceae bacterium]
MANISMEELQAHPNTQAVLDAWRRLSDGTPATEGPTTDDYPGLVGRLFVLNHVAERDYEFRRVGYALERLFGRQLTDHNFLSIWGESDRRLVAAALSTAVSDRGPTLIRARGETLVGKRVDLEFALAPLFGKPGAPARFLGLCQTMTPEDVLAGRPLRRLQAMAIFPPAPTLHPAVRIVSSR